VEGEWQCLKVFFSNGFVVDPHVVVDGFFVAEVVVVLHLAVEDGGMRGVVLFFLVVILIVSFLSFQASWILSAASTIGLSLFLKIKLRACVSQRGRSQFVFLWSFNYFLFRRIALLVGGLGGELAVDVAASPSRVGTLFLVFFLLFDILDFLPRFDAVQDLVGFPLCPDKVVVVPVIVVSHRPPES